MKNFLKNNVPLGAIIAFLIEALLLVVIFGLLFMGLVGSLLPVMPGLLFVALAAGVYSLMVKAGYNKMSGRAHPHLMRYLENFLNLKIIKKIMGVIKSIKKKKQEKIKEEILKHGLILFTFNSILLLAFVLAFVSLSFLTFILNLPMLFSAFMPLFLIFVFAGGSAVVWYRFGQILATKFKDKKVINAGLVVLLSILPTLVFLMVISSLINYLGGFGSDLVAILFLGTIVMSVLAAAFELLIVDLGVLTEK